MFERKTEPNSIGILSGTFDPILLPDEALKYIQKYQLYGYNNEPFSIQIGDLRL